jgi:hypothetical protein
MGSFFADHWYIDPAMGAAEAPTGVTGGADVASGGEGAG